MEETKPPFEQSLENGIHFELSKLAGSWEGTAKTWFEKDELADESPVKGSIKAILGGRYLQHEYQGSWGGKPLEGMAIIGYSFDEQKFQTAWVDTFHMGTGILFSQGDAMEHGHSVLGSYGGVAYKERWGWRTETVLTADDQLIFTAYNISPEGEEVKATETIYKRLNSGLD